MMKFLLCCMLSGALLVALPYTAYAGDSTASSETASDMEEDEDFRSESEMPANKDTALPPTKQQSDLLEITDTLSQSDSPESAGKTDTAGAPADIAAESSTVNRSPANSTAEENTTKTGAASSTSSVQSGGEAETADSAKDTASPDSKTNAESEQPTKPDYSVGSISQTGLIVAEENRWYYEEFDLLGRPLIAVLFDKEIELETIHWKYEGKSHHPVGKTTVTAGKTEENIRYDAAGNIILIEHYDAQKKLLEKTENSYDSHNHLVQQIVFNGQHHDKTVWEYTKDKAVSQTKYRNDEKTAFIELLDEKRIIHVFVDGKEVFVTEEP
ncbi:MAG: hypothetical protein ACTTH7_00960 [Treponema sp.]